MFSDNEFEEVLKVVLVGQESAGKTQIVNRFVHDAFSAANVSTIGVDFKIKHVIENDKRFVLQIWDTAGQEKYRTITQSYFRNAHALMIVCDLSDIKSFYVIEENLADLKKYKRLEDNPLVILVGAKSDLSERAISTAKFKAIGLKYKLPCIETSSLSNKGIDEAFRMVTQWYFKKNEQHSEKPDILVDIPLNTLQPAEKKEEPVKPSFLKRQYGKIIFSALLVTAIVTVGIFTGGVVPAIGVGIAGIIGVSAAIGSYVGVGLIMLASLGFGAFLGGLMGKLSESYLFRHQPQQNNKRAGSTFQMNGIFGFSPYQSPETTLVKSSIKQKDPEELREIKHASLSQEVVKRRII